MTKATRRPVVDLRGLFLPMLFGVALLVGCTASGGSVSPNLATASSEATPVVPRIEPTSGDTVDGFKLGVLVACSPGVGLTAAELDRGCVGYPIRATAALDTREPGHPAIVGVATYSDGTQPEPVDYTANAPDPTPPPTPHAGPSVHVFVFTLADGTYRATGVACTGRGPTSSCVGIGEYPAF